MTALLGFVIFITGAALGLFVGAYVGSAARLDLMDELEDAEAEIDRLRGA